MKAQFEIDAELYATQGQRIANFLIDYVVQILLLMGIVFVYAFVQALQGSAQVPNLEALGAFWEYVIGLVMLLFYYNISEILSARTVGKLVTGTIVVDEFGEKPSVNTILMRSICRAIPFEFITFIFPPFRGWHDSFSGTYVVQKGGLDKAKAQFYGSETKIADQGSPIEIRRTTSENPDFVQLVRELDAVLAELDGEDHAFYAQFNKTAGLKNVVVCYHNNQAVGCGAFRPYDDKTVEIKRMYTKPGHRGKGIASQILASLEEWAAQENYATAILETGNKQKDAISLYQTKGYTIIPNYGQYENIANSICMQKNIQ